MHAYINHVYYVVCIVMHDVTVWKYALYARYGITYYMIMALWMYYCNI